MWFGPIGKNSALTKGLIAAFALVALASTTGCGGGSSDDSRIAPPGDDGGPDAQPSQQKVAIPELDPGPGTYASAQSVAIHSATAGATIFFTLDGTAPNRHSAMYTAPLTVAQTTTIKAIAVEAGFEDSDVRSGPIRDAAYRATLVV